MAKIVPRLFFSALAILGGLCLALSASPLRAKEANPVIDGDTLVIDGRLVQLAGIDAPELGQRCFNQGKSWRCGLEAALALRKLISFGDVVCEPDKSNPQSAQASCSVADKDLATALLQQGYAVALPEASSTLHAAENSAKEAKFGIWRGDFVAPASWRDGVRLPGEESDPQYCVIKGTINEKDQRVFYVPSDEGYDAIVIDPSRGERMFCSDDQAILRGWRPFPKAKS